MLAGRIFPPHPISSSRIQRSDLSRMEKSGKWLAQLKFNGIHTVVRTDGKKTEIWDRRCDDIVNYKLKSGMARLIANLAKDGTETVVVGELLHTKAKSKVTNEQAVKDTIVLFDILYRGEYLLDQTQVERLDLLSEICGRPAEKEPKGRGLVVGVEGESQLWLAENFSENFLDTFDKYATVDDRHGVEQYPEIEGLVLRLRDSTISNLGRKLYDVRWMVRCRREKPKVYQF